MPRRSNAAWCSENWGGAEGELRAPRQHLPLALLGAEVAAAAGGGEEGRDGSDGCGTFYTDEGQSVQDLQL